MRECFKMRLIDVGAGVVIAMSLIPTSAVGQQGTTASLQDNVRPPVQPGEIRLKVDSKAPASLPESWARAGDKYIAHNVSQPSITPFLPAPGTANGTAVVIAPGGGFMMLSMSSEGWDVARWLASKGVTAFVLKYRLLPTPADTRGTWLAIAQMLAAPPETKAQTLATGTRFAVEDGQEAMRYVRANAARWGIDPKKVGFMGFSAGALTTMGLVSADRDGTMPSFVAPIYGSVDTPASPLPNGLPPLWTSLASDDEIFGKSDFGLINAWRAKGGSVEFHLYAKGGHGYGFEGKPNTTSTTWPGAFLSWLQTLSLAGSAK